MRCLARYGVIIKPDLPGGGRAVPDRRLIAENAGYLSWA